MGPAGKAASATWRRLGRIFPLLAAVLFLAAAILLTTLVPRRLQQRVLEDRTELEEVVRPARSLTADLGATLDREAAAVRGYLLDRDVRNKERYGQARAREDSILLQLAPLARRLGAQSVAQLSAVRTRAAAWHIDQERLLLEEPGFAPEFLRRMPAQLELYDGATLAAERLGATLAGIETARLDRLTRLLALQEPVMRGVTWLAGLALLITLLLAWRLMALQRRPPRHTLEESERRFGDLVDSMREVFWIRDAGTGRFIYVSPAYESVWGRSSEPLYAGFGPFLATVHPEDRRRVEAATPPGELEYRIVRPDGTIRWIAERCLSMSAPADGSVRWLGVAGDVTERFEARQHLTHLALHDPVTGLGNHLLLLDRLEHALARAKRARMAVAVLVVDVVDFRSVNDELGWAAGDRLLAAVGKRLQGTLRQEDTLVRLGDDAFMAVLEQVEKRGGVLRAAARISAAFEVPFTVDGGEVELRVRVASAISEAGALTSADLGRLADEARHRASLDPSAPFEPAGQAAAVELPGATGGRGRLRQALEDAEFRVHYQPVLDLHTDRLVGLEALLRWEHPGRGLLFPHDFLTLAEESGLIHPLGQWVLRKVCADLRSWENEPPPLRDAWVSVNLSRSQFELPDFVAEVTRILDSTGALPARLRIEVDEATWFRARKPLRRLRDLGIAVAIDGFGERFGALGALRRLPVDAIKINRRLGFSPFGSESTSAAVASFVGLASGLGLEVTAVGIENSGELRGLKALGCPTGQGFHLSPPLSDEALRDWTAGRGRARAQGSPS
jgi:diguanylate cyclase (GGDEF)-like protein/PAS domain S-box-containing protein